MKNREIAEIQTQLKAFAKERNWEQFHSPKNLAMALSVEVSELLEHFQWLTEEQSYIKDTNTQQEISEEIADVFLYLLQLSDKLHIDIIQAAQEKLNKNALKYPVELSKGKSTKYTKF